MCAIGRPILSGNCLFGNGCRHSHLRREEEASDRIAAEHGDKAYAQLQALGQLAAQIQQQAVVMTYSETFYVLGIILLLCIPLALLLRRPVSVIRHSGH